jgi:hypothetical protein
LLVGISDRVARRRRSAKSLALVLAPVPWGGIAMPRGALFAPSDNERAEVGADRRPAIIRWIAPALTVLFVAAAVLVVSLVAAVAGLL